MTTPARKTVRDAIHELEHLSPESRLTKLDVLRLLPPDTPAPTISNTRAVSGAASCTPLAWCGYSSPVRAADFADVLRQFEGAGYTPAPCIMAWWDRYAPSPFPSSADDAMESRPGRTLTRYADMIPLWYRCGTFTGGEWYAYMVSPEGDTLLLHGDAPGGGITLRAEREVWKGRDGTEWRYRPGSARVHSAPSWSRLTDGETTYATLSMSGRLGGDPMNSQSLEGMAWWETIQGEYPSLSAIVDTLTGYARVGR